MRIGLDIDGVIAKSMDELVIRYRKDIDPTYLCNDPYNQWKFYDIELVLEDASREWIDEQFHDPTYFLNAQPFEDAWYAITRWFSIGHDIILITRRHNNAVEATERWFDEWAIPYNKLVSGSIKGHKWENLLEEECEVFVDDDPDEVRSASEHGVQTFLRKHGYNAQAEVGPKVRTIGDLKNIDHHVRGLQDAVKLG